MIIFDLDGTLALNEHRQHFVKGPKGDRDWDGFFDACGQDEPNAPIIDTLKILIENHHVEIWTGRIERVKVKTKIWLRNQGLGRVPLRMRPEGEHCPDTELKQRWIDEASLNITMAFDDRDSVVAMWRANGIVCCQVAPGNF